MWKCPDNIPSDDWPALTRAWDARKDEVYGRFAQYAKAVSTDEIDGIIVGLLDIYYQVEIHAHQGADWITRLRDEFRKGVWVEKQIRKLRKEHPELQEKIKVRFIRRDGKGYDCRPATLADKCMGAIVNAFIEITAEVYADRFGKPFGDNPRALRNEIPERSAWTKGMQDYRDQWRTYLLAKESNPDTSEPPIYRQ